jgi:hypothetical protein
MARRYPGRAGDQRHLPLQNLTHAAPVVFRTSSRLAASAIAALQAAFDTLGHAGQHLARAALEHVSRTTTGDFLHRLDPADRRISLAHQGILDAHRVGLDRHIHIVEHRDRRHAHFDVGQALLQTLGSRLHQRSGRARSPAAAPRAWRHGPWPQPSRARPQRGRRR